MQSVCIVHMYMLYQSDALCAKQNKQNVEGLLDQGAHSSYAHACSDIGMNVIICMLLHAQHDVRQSFVHQRAPLHDTQEQRTVPLAIYSVRAKAQRSNQFNSVAKALHTHTHTKGRVLLVLLLLATNPQ